MSKNVEAKKGSLLIKVIFFIGIVVLVFTILAAVNASYKKREVQKEIAKLRAEAERIEKENLGLGEKIAYLNSKDYQEREAKDKLNLQNKEENVVIIKPDMEKEPVIMEDKHQEEKKLIVKTSNVQKWWNYFFKY